MIEFYTNKMKEAFKSGDGTLGITLFNIVTGLKILAGELNPQLKDPAIALRKLRFGEIQ